MKLEFIKANPGSRYNEENDFAKAQSFNGATITITEKVIEIKTNHDTIKFNLTEWERDFLFTTDKSEYPNGGDLRILQSSIMNTITFASLYKDGYAVHYNLID